MRRNQSGMTLISFVIVAAVVGTAAYIGMKLFPMYQEFYGVKSAAKGLAAEAGIANEQPAQIKQKLFRRFNIGYVSSVKPEHVKIDSSGSSKVMRINYEVRVSIVGNLDAVGRFNVEQPLTGTATY
jgi:Tfp pilus assembly major pilin PilA